MRLIRLNELMEAAPDPSSEQREVLFPSYYSHWCPFQIAKLHLGLRNTVILAHAPQGCVGAERAFESTYSGQYFGEPFYYTPCTDMRDQDVILGGRDKLEEALIEVDRIYRPELIIVLYSCATGMIRDPVNEVKNEVRSKLKARVIVVDGMGIKHHACGRINDHISKCFVELVNPPANKHRRGVNIVGVISEVQHLRGRFPNDPWEYRRMIEGIGLEVHAVLWQGARVDDLANAAAAEFNALDCPSWGFPFVEALQREYGIAYGKKSQPLGISATREWLMEIAQYFGVEQQAARFIDAEYANIQGTWDEAGSLVAGKVALIDGGDPMSAVGRCLVWGRMCADLGMRPIIYNAPPVEFKGKPHHVRYSLDDGFNPEIIWSDYAYHRRISPWKVLDYLGLTTKDVGTYIGDVFPRSLAVDGKPVFDPSNAPRVITTTHMSRKITAPGRRVGFAGARGFAEDIIKTVKMASKNSKPSLLGRLAGLR